MNRKNILFPILSLFIAILLPALTVAFARGDAGMLICMLLLYGIDPIAAVAAGIFAGMNRGWAWIQPTIFAVGFFIGAGISFDAFSPISVTFLAYTAAYLLIGYAAAGITVAVRRAKSK